ncbi:UNVERIFIED_ORG: hypothetical protein EDF86_0732 [Pseudomonas psychrophila]|jgi:hypothetical protein
MKKVSSIGGSIEAEAFLPRAFAERLDVASQTRQLLRDLGAGKSKAPSPEGEGAC